MTFELALALIAIGLVGSFISGMLGIGGAIIKYPLILYVPVLLGVGAFSAHEVAAISAVEVVFATIPGVIVFRRSGFLHWRLTAVMGAAILLGSTTGAWASAALQPATINAAYAVLATIAALLMFVRRPASEYVAECEIAATAQCVPFNPTVAAAAALLIGAATGIVGAAGAFLLVPVMLTILRIPTRVTIATSLAVTFLAAIGSASGKLLTGQVPLLPAAIMIAASLLGALLGAHLSTRVNPRLLRAALALIISATAIQIWFTVLVPDAGA